MTRPSASYLSIFRVSGNYFEPGSLLYCRNFVYSWAGELQYLMIDEGRIIPDSNGFLFEYYLKDHLGNNRAVYAPVCPGLAQVAAINHYYPFGMLLESLCYSSGADIENNYLYNGKEMQSEYGLEWYDYGARFYDPQIGRWQVIDEKAEKFSFVSPYVYAINNPVKFIDPDGKEIYLSLNPAHTQALQNMMSTKTGREFIGRYMPAGSTLKVGNQTYKFDQAGDRAKDALFIRSDSKMGSLGLNDTYRKDVNLPVNIVTDAKDITKGVRQVIDLNTSLDAKQATGVLGHEAFVHTDKDADRLNQIDKNAANGVYDGNQKQLIDDASKIENSGTEDHYNFSQGKVKKYEQYAKELDKNQNTNANTNAYEQDRKDYISESK